MSNHQKTLERLRGSLTMIEAAGTDASPAVGSADEASTSELSTSHPRAAAPASGDLSVEESSVNGDDYSKAKAVVLRKLTGSAKSRYQLTQTLRERDFNEQVIVEVLDRMEEVYLVDDAEFARMWVRTRHEIKGLGVAALRQELRDKGIIDEHAEVALGQISTDDEASAARKLIDNKLRRITLPAGNSLEERKERDKITRRLMGMLARRGHPPGQALMLVREALESRFT